MGQPRASRRKVVAISSDEDETVPERAVSEPSEDDEPVKSQKRGTGKLNPVNKRTSTQQPTPVTSTQEGSSQKSPAKPRIARSKTASKDPSKANGKPIYSFFNAATQRQQLSQPSASPGKLCTDEPEVIHDDSDDNGTSLALSKGSSTALAVRKRKAQHTAGPQDESSLAPSATQKFRKTSDGGRTPSFSVINEDKRPWIEQFAPLNLSELAVHKRKVADVRQWLETAINAKRQKVLVLKGAAGTGKTATVRLLAQDLGAEVAEWQNPAGADMAAEGALSTANHFEDFVHRAAKSASLMFTAADGVEEMQSHGDTGSGHDITNRARQLLLVEEFPNTFSRSSATLQSFRSTILQYVSSPPVQEGSVTPIVMIASETLLSTNTAAADSFTAHRLLGPELVNHPFINTIEFNPVAPTILIKVLENVVIREARKSGRRRAPGPQVLKRLADTGDIRSAISSLEFLCLRNDDGDVWSSKVHFTKPKKKPDSAMTKAEEDVLKLVSNRESSLGIFHAVGRVVYNNRIDPPSGQTLAQPPAWLPRHRRAKLPERDVDSLIDELGTETSTFIAALHENYVLSCASSRAEDALDSLTGCADSISDADLLSVDRFSFGTRAFSGSAVDGLRQDEMAFQVAVRGMLFSLPCPVHRSASVSGSKADAHRMFYPTSLKLWKRREEIEGMLELLTAQTQSGKVGEIRPSYLPPTFAQGDGVESWGRRNNFGQSSKQAAASEVLHAPLPTVTKDEMLLERLPYLAQVLAARQDTPEPSTLLRQASMVSRMTGRATTAPDDADAEQDEGDAAGVIDLWSTDKPDLDSDVSKQKAKVASNVKKVNNERGGLAVPVERRVEQLVLRDDDIVDD